MSRPPLTRPLVAALLVVAGLALELTPAQTVSHPYTTGEIDPGQPVTAIEWREIPAGLIPSIDGHELVARVTLAAGTPLTPDVLGRAQAPEDWWSMVIELPSLIPPGTPILLIPHGNNDKPPIDGLVLEASVPDEFAYGPPSGLVAVNPDGALEVARSSAEGTLVVLMLPG